MKTLIIEDEVDSQDLLKHLLTLYCEDIVIVAIESSISSGIRSYNKLKPNLVFLDIELSDGSGFDFLSKVDHSESIVIIISGYDNYGIEAIKASAFDYFLKPYSVDELSNTVKEARKQLKSKTILHRINNSEANNLVEISDKKFIYKDSKGIKIIDASTISHISVNEPYCRLFLKDGSSLFIQITLASILSQLPKYFFKIHRSHAINLREVQEWEGGRGGKVTMNNKLTLPIAYRIKKQFVLQMSQYLNSLHSNVSN